MASGDVLESDTPRTIADADTLADGVSPGLRVVETDELRAGETLDHFVIIGVAGRGGMGVVYTAYDSQLDRKVAIKRLRPDRHEGDSKQARRRLLREAHALAKLNHENVVAVHQVFEIGDEAYVAMEHVAGGTLDSWIAEDHRDWKEIVSIYARAGRGLAAAHRAGLIHRDFKPANVLVGDDGRVCVTDFGLARATHRDEPDPVTPGSGRATTAVPLSAELTDHDTLLGTPGYVAPELIRDVEADGRSDQFSFCVALFAALYGVRPFTGDTAAAIISATLRGEIDEVPASDVPAWIDRAVRRGLSLDPADRFESMDALLEALADDPSVRRRRRLRAGLAIAAFGSLAALSIFGLTRGDDPESRCTGAGERVDAIWSPDARDAVHKAFADTGRTYADQTFERVAGNIDGYRRGWVTTHERVCRATHVHGEQSAAALDARMTCLSRRLGELEALVELFAEKPDVQVLDRAIRSVSGLTPASSCADMPVSGGPAARGAAPLDEADRELARARALAAAGNYPAAARAIEPLVEASSPRLSERQLVSALLLLGDLYDSLGRAEEADAVLKRGLDLSSPLRDDALDAELWITRLWVVGYSLAREDPAAEIETIAKAAVARAGDRPRLLADLAKKSGAVALRHGKYEESRGRYERALEIVERHFGENDPERAVALGNLGNVLRLSGHYELAREKLELALALDRELLGESHPDLAYSLTMLGQVNAAEDKPDQAQAYYERALELRVAALGPEHPDVAMSLTDLGQALRARGDTRGALARFERAVAITRKARGDRHPDVAGHLINQGDVLLQLGRADKARAVYERALEIWEATLDPEHPDIGIALLGLGEVDVAAGDCGAAIPRFERALALFLARLEPEHPNIARARERLASCRNNRR